MKIDILTLFPEMFKGPFDESIVNRAQDKKLIEINIHNLRKWTKDKHKAVDDRPYGGGTGMVIMIQPVFDAVESLKLKMQNVKCNPPAGGKNSKLSKIKEKVTLLTPQGKTFNQQKTQQLSQLDHLILICGHYEGVDERIRKYLVDEEISIGDYILTGGEIPAMVVVDAITRLIPGVLEKPEAIKFESFSPSSILEYPHYTRPSNFKGWKVPEILLSGDHKKIQEWRKKQALKRTKKRRPDLLKPKKDNPSRIQTFKV